MKHTNPTENIVKSLNLMKNTPTSCKHLFKNCNAWVPMHKRQYEPCYCVKTIPLTGRSWAFLLSHCHSAIWVMLLCPVSVQIAHATFAAHGSCHTHHEYDQDILLQRPTVEVGRTIAHFNLCNGCIHFFNIVSAVMCTCRSSNAPSASSMSRGRSCNCCNQSLAHYEMQQKEATSQQ
jgi:hypothetical protein